MTSALEMAMRGLQLNGVKPDERPADQVTSARSTDNKYVKAPRCYFAPTCRKVAWDSIDYTTTLKKVEAAFQEVANGFAKVQIAMQEGNRSLDAFNEHAEKLSDNAIALRQLRENFHDLNDKLAQANALRDLQILEYKRYALEETESALNEALNSPQYQLASENLAKWRIACKDAFLGTLSEDEKINRIKRVIDEAALFIKTQYDDILLFEPRLFLRIYTTHKNAIFEFHCFVAQFSQEQDRIRELRNTLQELDQLKNPHKESQEATDSRFEASSQAESYSRQFEYAPAQSDERLLEAGLQARIVDLQENFVKGLIFIRNDIRSREEAMCQGTTVQRTYSAAVVSDKIDPTHDLPIILSTLNTLERNFNQHMNRLKSVPVTVNQLEVYTFASELRHLFDTVRTKILDFRNLCDQGIQLLLLGQSNLSSLLAGRAHPISSARSKTGKLGQIGHLFYACVDTSLARTALKNGRQLEFFQETQKFLVEALSTVGRELLDEKKGETLPFVRQVLAKDTVKSGKNSQLDEELKFACVTKAEKFLHFTPLKKRADAVSGAASEVVELKVIELKSDPEFDLFLHVLLNDPLYKPLSMQSCQEDKVFANVMSSYCQAVKLDEDSRHLELFSRIYMLLERIEKDIKRSIPLAISRYAELSFFMLKVSQERAISHRYEALRAKATERIYAIQAKLPLPDYVIRNVKDNASARLLHELLQILQNWLWSGTSLKETQTAINAFWENHLDFELLESDQLLPILLMRYIVAKKEARSNILDREMRVLERLIALYDKEPGSQIAFDELCNQVALHLCRYTLHKLGKLTIKYSFESKWLEAMDSFVAFHELLERYYTPLPPVENSQVDPQFSLSQAMILRQAPALPPAAVQDLTPEQLHQSARQLIDKVEAISEPTSDSDTRLTVLAGALRDNMKETLKSKTQGTAQQK